MRKRIWWMIFPVAALMLCGCDVIDAGLNTITVRGSGKVASEKREVRGFQRVDLTSVGELTISQGDRESLTIEADDNILPKIRTEVEGDRLVIGVERGISIRPAVPLVYRLVVRELTGLGLSGSGKILTGPLRCRDLAVHLPGSGEIRFDQLTADTLRAEISGSGHIEIPGKVIRQDVHISGSGGYSAKNLESQSAEVSISGSGDLSVWVHDTLTVHISGSGGVEYYGSPKVTQSVSGSGGVRHLGARP